MIVFFGKFVIRIFSYFLPKISTDMRDKNFKHGKNKKAINILNQLSPKFYRSVQAIYKCEQNWKCSEYGKINENRPFLGRPNSKIVYPGRPCLKIDVFSKLTNCPH